MILNIKLESKTMIKGKQNSMNKAMLAMILHTLQESDSEDILPTKEPKKREESIPLDERNSYTFIEI